MSFQGFIKAQGQVLLSNINDAITPSLYILTHSIPPREYCQLILKGYLRGSFKTACQVSLLHQSTLATTFIQYSLDLSRPVFSIINPGKSNQLSSFLNVARYTLHQAVNTDSRIQYRPAFILKD
ncbi:hypothetical protein O181_064194 [Austropuccinia psidii MF-1]|uniref:Uncharacterized protein n=1 Tax=Austropuccinia psidii MF-1 TaxID=1389203 RepID=A0A9Q3ENY0_9BASI|nr:hypothetical protein [Austropuccinia psidii MF-1]